ncbi:phage capsid protein, partial [Vibrio anguillarum]|nr:phage capsid protein [Vibrio anguillarum]
MVPNRPKIAPFCSPMIGGQVDRNQGYETTSFKPAYVKSKHVVNGNMTLKRMPGEAPTALKTPEERQALHVMQNLDLEEEAVSMREELMAAQMIIHGEYLVDGPNIEEPYVISSPRKAENNITLIGDARWTQKDRATFDPLAEITKES